MRALLLVLALAACGPGGRAEPDAMPLPTDARFDGTLAMTVNGAALTVESVHATYYGASNAVIIRAEVRCAGCASPGLVTIGLRQPGPADCEQGSGIQYSNVDLHLGGVYGSSGTPPCGLTVDAYGTDFGARVAGSFAGTLTLDEIGEPMTVEATISWDVTL
jgi:hypothetical protein